MDAESLIALESRYAPQVGKGRGVFSPHDHNGHAPWNLGGDKMADDRNGYAPVYAHLLDGLDPACVVELGVFQGASMAIWCDLFPYANVIGLDLDFDRFEENRPVLIERGAFTVNYPLFYQFDAYQPAAHPVDGHAPFDLFIDDGPHTADAIANVVRLVSPLMRDGGVYVIEDFPGGDDILASAFPEAREIVRAGRLNAARL